MIAVDVLAFSCYFRLQHILHLCWVNDIHVSLAPSWLWIDVLGGRPKHSRVYWCRGQTNIIRRQERCKLTKISMECGGLRSVRNRRPVTSSARSASFRPRRPCDAFYLCEMLRTLRIPKTGPRQCSVLVNIAEFQSEYARGLFHFSTRVRGIVDVFRRRFDVRGVL